MSKPDKYFVVFKDEDKPDLKAFHVTLVYMGSELNAFMDTIMERLSSLAEANQYELDPIIFNERAHFGQNGEIPVLLPADSRPSQEESLAIMRRMWSYVENWSTGEYKSWAPHITTSLASVTFDPTHLVLCRNKYEIVQEWSLA